MSEFKWCWLEGSTIKYFFLEQHMPNLVSMKTHVPAAWGTRVLDLLTGLFSIWCCDLPSVGIKASIGLTEQGQVHWRTAVCEQRVPKGRCYNLLALGWTTRHVLLQGGKTWGPKHKTGFHCFESTLRAATQLRWWILFKLLYLWWMT